MNNGRELGPEKQAWLLPYENPLISRFNSDFFAQIPRLPGVYIMMGEDRSILYIGKAKDLRARLLSYRRANPDQVSRKVIRMIRLIRFIEWEECESEEAALLRENHLLRLHRPPFNIVNVSPESYYFIGFIREGPYFRFRLTTQAETPNDAQGKPRDGLYGAYKGRGSIREGYGALLRLLWAIHGTLDRMGFPAALTRRRPAYRYDLRVPEPLDEAELKRWESQIKRFLNGTSKSLLVEITEKLLAREDLPRFVYGCIQEDLDRLHDFYSFGPRRNQTLRRHHKLGGRRRIEQEELDDLIVMYRSHKQREAESKSRARRLPKSVS